MRCLGFFFQSPEDICSRKLVYSFILMIGAANFGYCMGYAPSAEPTMKKIFPKKEETKLVTDEWEWFKYSSYLAAIGGAFFTWLLLTFFSRRSCVFMNALSATTFWFLLFILDKPSIFVLFLLRIGCGFSLGGFSCLIPLYIVELSPDESTGFFGTLNQFGIAVGFVLVYSFGLLPDQLTRFNWSLWRTLALICACFMFLFCFLIWLVEQSPADLSPPLESELPIDIDTNLCSGTWIRKLLICICLMLFQQLTGINFYLTNLNILTHEDDNGNAEKSTAFSIYASSAQVVACFIGALLIEKWGRRLIWTLSLLMMMIINIAYAILLKHTKNKILGIVLIFLFIFGFGFGCGPIPWFFVPEFFPVKLHASAMAIITATNWIFAFLVNFFGEQYIFGTQDPNPHDPFANIRKNWQMFIGCGILSGIGAVFGFFFVRNPERAVRKNHELFHGLYDDLDGTE